VAPVLAAPASTEPCAPSPTILCLFGGRFAVEVAWATAVESGPGRVIELNDTSGLFWFFRSDNVELVVKVLDGRPVNGRFWFFYGALSDVEYEITVTDTTTGAVQTYDNEKGDLCGRGDTGAFDPDAMTGAASVEPAGRAATREPIRGSSSLLHAISFAAPPPLAVPPLAVAFAVTQSSSTPSAAAPSAGAPSSWRTPLSFAPTAGTCTPGDQRLCLLDGRFAVEVDWRNQHAEGATGHGGAIPLGGRSGLFWFFRPQNVELVVKALDGRAINGRFWFFYGALSDVEYALAVTDTVSGEQQVYENPPGELCGRGDTRAFRDDDDPRLPFRLASAPVQAVLGDPLVFGLRGWNLGSGEDLAADVDVVSVHQDFLGIPWDAFADGTPPPAAWVARIDELRAWTAIWQRPVYLSLALVAGDGRAFLAPRARGVPGGLALDGEWSGRCFNFRTHPDGERWRRAYLAYVRYMVQRFDPAYLTQGIEVNLFRRSCDGADPEAWDALVDLLNDAYAAAKEVKPWLPVFPSVELSSLSEVGDGGACFDAAPGPCLDANLARLAGLERDRFAMSFYPHLVEAGGVDLDYAAFFDAVLDRVSGERGVFAETGYDSAPLTVDVGWPEPSQCFEVLASSPARQRAYFDAVVDVARRRRMDLVTWWSNRDVLPTEAAATCPCADPHGFCDLLDLLRGTTAEPFIGELLFKAFASMGVRDYDGEPKALLQRWQEVRAEEAARR